MSSEPFTCRSCGSRTSHEVVNLGHLPPANRLLSSEELANGESTFPLRLLVCDHCWLMQIGETIPPAELFSDYVYFSSFSDTTVRHAREAAGRCLSDYGLGPESLVVEIASNDGYLLRNFQSAGVPCLGVEPAANIAQVSRDLGIETLMDFFSAGSARRISESHGQANLILGNNVFAHVPEPNDFVAGLARLLKPEGRAILEFPYAVDFLANTEFDTIYHEHVFYFSLTALAPLFARHRLDIVDVEHLPIHGGSLRLFARHAGVQAPTDTVGDFLSHERDLGIDTLEPYRTFAERVRILRSHLPEMLDLLRSQGNSIAAYGASAKGSILLNYCGIGPERVDFVADRSPHKHGRFMPGSRIPIQPADELARRRPDYALLLAWNFADEILSQQQAYRDAGGRFIIPFPEPSIL